MKRTWIVSGTWDRTGESGSMTLQAATRDEADALAKSRGLSVTEAMSVGGVEAKPATRPAAKPARAKPDTQPATPTGASPPPATLSRTRGRRMSPARRAAIAAQDDARSSLVPLIVMALGALLLVTGILSRNTVDPLNWSGELLQLLGLIVAGVGLWLWSA